MRKVLVLILLVVTTVASYSQGYDDFIQLGNGSEIYGQIINKSPGGSLKIVTADQHVFIFEDSEISYFQIKKKAKVAQQPTKYYIFIEPGYTGRVEVGYEVGVGSLALDRLKLNIINGYQINDYFAVGIGTGLRYYIDAEEALIPLFADLKVNYLMGDKVTRYVTMGVGYTFNATDSFRGVGLFLSPSIGLSYKLSDKNAINVSLGYEVQKFDLSDDLLKSINAGAVSVNVGVSF